MDEQHSAKKNMVEEKDNITKQGRRRQHLVRTKNNEEDNKRETHFSLVAHHTPSDSAHLHSLAFHLGDSGS